MMILDALTIDWYKNKGQQQCQFSMLSKDTFCFGCESKYDERTRQLQKERERNRGRRQEKHTACGPHTSQKHLHISWLYHLEVMHANGPWCVRNFPFACAEHMCVLCNAQCTQSAHVIESLPLYFSGSQARISESLRSA